MHQLAKSCSIIWRPGMPRRRTPELLRISYARNFNCPLHFQTNHYATIYHGTHNISALLNSYPQNFPFPSQRHVVYSCILFENARSSLVQWYTHLDVKSQSSTKFSSWLETARAILMLSMLPKILQKIRRSKTDTPLKDVTITQRTAIITSLIAHPMLPILLGKNLDRNRRSRP